MLVVGDVADDRRALAGVGPQVLRLAAGVARDHRVGGRQDGLGGAVVLLQQDRRGVRVVLLEGQDVADRRAAEGVDRLVGVTDDAQLGRWHAEGRLAARDQLADQHVLRVVGVLVLVDQHVPEPAPVVLGDVGERLQQVHGGHDQVVEVERVGLVQPALVEPVGLGQGLLHVRLGPSGEGLVVDELVLEVAHLRRERPGRVALRVEVEVAADQGHQPLGVGLVVDREGRLHPEVAGLAAQDAHAGGVEGAHPHRLGPAADQSGDPLLHLAGGLVGEGDGEHRAGMHLALGQQVGDPGGQDPGLARAGAGDDEQRAALVDHRGALLGVESLEQGRGVGSSRPVGRGRSRARRERVGVVEEGAHLPTSLGVGPDGSGVRPQERRRSRGRRRAGAPSPRRAAG